MARFSNTAALLSVIIARIEEISMKRFATAIAAALLAGTAAAADTPSSHVADRLSWLAGCWGGQKGGPSFRETWTVVTPDLLLGMGSTTTPSKPVEFDFLRVEGGAKG